MKFSHKPRIRVYLSVLSLLGIISIKAFAEERSVACRPCPAGTKKIALLIYGKELNKFPSTGRPLTWFDPPSGMQREYYEAESWDGVPAIIAEIAGGCPRIGYLAFATHGNLGVVAIGHQSLDAYGFIDRFSGLDCVMADNARIEFGGCFVGRGCRGESFLMAVAQTLLHRGGGSIKAPTSAEVGFLGVSIGSMNGDNQFLYVKPGLKSFSWDNSPQSVKKCRDKANEVIKLLPTLQEANQLCGKAEYQDDINYIRAKLNISIGLSNYEQVWAYPDSTHFKMGQTFYDAFNQYEVLLDKIGKCVTPILIKNELKKNPLFQLPTAIKRSLFNQDIQPQNEPQEAKSAR
jgi:hypothetical protein